MCMLNSDLHKIQLAKDFPDFNNCASSLVNYTDMVMKNCTVILLMFDNDLPAGHRLGAHYDIVRYLNSPYVVKSEGLQVGLECK